MPLSRLIFFAAFCVAFAVTARAADVPPNPDHPSAGIETGKGWAVDKGLGSKGKVERVKVGERNLLKLMYEPGEHDQTLFKLIPGFAVPKDNTVRLWVYSELESPPPISIVAGVSLNFVWTESEQVALRRGWNAVAIPCSEGHWKSEGSGWKYTLGLSPHEDVRYTEIVIFNKKESGSILVEGFCAVSAETIAEAKAQDKEDYWREGWKHLASRGEGFVVWQSNRTGHWAIWKRNLDGSDERQLSPKEPERDHVAPHISPDGAHVVYLSVPKESDVKERAHPSDKVFPLKIMNADGQEDRVIVPNARTYNGDRCAVWVDGHTLIYIGADGSTRQLDLATQKDDMLLAGSKNPVLINAQKTHGTVGMPPIFSNYETGAHSASPLIREEGCQAYFSHEGPWATWMNGSGGPVCWMRLDTLESGTILDYHDTRLPAARNYVYFPMLSRSGRLLAFAASPNQFEHYKSDYDIFVAAFDPEKFEIKGKPVRYTFDTHTDIFPDVYGKLPELGYASGKAPFTTTFHLPKEGRDSNFVFDYGDESPVKVGPQTHTYTAPGEYAVVAKRGAEVLRGFVDVAPRKPPAATSVAVVGEREIRVNFDEDVNLEKFACKLESGQAIERWTPGAKVRSTILTLKEKLARNDVLLIEGATDLAQQPNTMLPAKLPVKALIWPAQRDGLVFVWENGKQANTIVDPATKQPSNIILSSKGTAVFDRLYRMHFGGGHFLNAKMDAQTTAIKAGNAFTFEAAFVPNLDAKEGESKVIASFGNLAECNLALVQSKRSLHLYFRTEGKARNDFELASKLEGEPVHVMAGYNGASMTVLFNGKKVTVSTPSGGLANWAAVPLFFGDDGTGKNAWSGALGGVALFSRCLSDLEMRAEYDQHEALTRLQPKAPRLEVAAVLAATSKIETVSELGVYRNALVSCEYTVEKVIAGSYAKQKIRVFHWAWLDLQPMPIQKRKVGDKVTLILEPMSAQPQLKTAHKSDNWEADGDYEMWFDTGL